MIRDYCLQAKTALWPVIIICLFTGTLFGADKNGDYHSIEAAYQSGQIGYEEKLVRQIGSIFDPQTSSTALTTATEPVIKSATGLMMAVKDNWDNFSKDQQTYLSAYVGRPSLPYSYDSPGGYFKIHYNTVGSDAVPGQDDNFNSIPDIVERAGIYCDSSYSAFVTNMGYLPPPLDNGNGGDDKYDVYFLAILAYGTTYPDFSADSAWNDFSSFIGLNRNFYGFPPNDDPEGDTIGAHKVTCAHEYFHAVQLAYDNDFSKLWLMEACATRMEEVVFPEVNDNYNYLRFFFNEPETSLASNGGYHMYGTFIWPTYLEEKFDPIILKRTWEAIRYNSALDALDSALAPYAVKVADVFAEFTLWNYFTGARAIPGRYYTAAAEINDVDIDISYPTLVHDSVVPINGPDGLACNYIRFAVDTAKGILELELDGSSTVQWAFSAVISDDLTDTVLSAPSQLGQPVVFYYPHIGDYQTVTAIPTVISQYLENNTYYLSSRVIPYGDANYDRVVNVGDAVYLIAHIFKGNDEPVPIWETGDANCDGSINVGDVVTIIQFVFKGGPEPCSSR